jgi:CRP-like cAMP-binding protein
MDKQPLLQFIQNNIPNIRVTPDGIEAIAKNFEEMPLTKGELLLKQGKISGYYYLAEGCLRSYTFDPEGDEITTYFYTQGRVVFDAASFFLRAPSTENIQAITESLGYYTDFEKLNGLFHTVPEFREFGRAMLVKEFVAYKQRTLAMINRSAEERYAHLMTSHPEIFHHAQLKQIASYLGMTDTSLSRIRREFAQK